jgi:hypothetical protein
MRFLLRVILLRQLTGKEIKIYNAIYRTRGEYEKYFTGCLPEYFLSQTKAASCLIKTPARGRKPMRGIGF